MNPQVDKVVRITTMVATAVASYFLLTADYGPEPNVLDPATNLSFRDSLAVVDDRIADIADSPLPYSRLGLIEFQSIKQKIISAQDSVKEFIFPSKNK